jgi:hypothetical protein
MYKIVKDDNSFVRDTDTNAILNIDNEALTAYKLRKNANVKLKNDVDELKSELQEIKQLLKKMLDK